VSAEHLNRRTGSSPAQVPTSTNGRAPWPVDPDIVEAFITSTVEALLLDLQEHPDLTVDSRRGTDHPQEAA